MNIPRNEYPRPQLKREDWINLNGQWDFTYDDENKGIKDKWYLGFDFDKQITVPYAYQSNLSGIGNNKFHDIVWYKRGFSIPEKWQKRNIILHFGAVDYRTEIWLNGQKISFHEGGHTPFKVDITNNLTEGENLLILRVEDISRDMGQPRGKQYWKEQSEAIFYTRTTGIWQTVWLEAVADCYIDRVKMTPDLNSGEIMIEYMLNSLENELNMELEAEILFEEEFITKARIDIPEMQKDRKIKLGIDGVKYWSPETPHLYDVKFKLYSNGQLIDEVDSYFGMREIKIEDGKLLLNRKPYYMKLLLDQGYWPEGLLTAPEDEDFIKDIKICKEMGFNGVRKHQKVEDPRYLYWADKLGFLVWGEMANAHTYSDKVVKRMTTEWQEAVERDYNHPSLVVWVLLNESWGVPGLKRDQHTVAHSLSLYHLTKSLDQTRPVIANDGWEQTITDLCSIHDYEGNKEKLKERYSNLDNILVFEPSERDLFIKGFEYTGQPIFISEFGGIAYKKDHKKGWGYTTAENDDEFIERYYNVVSALLESPLVQGFCYTQITDVEQEINGLLTYDRKPKVDPTIIRAINMGKALEELKVEN